MVDFPTKPEPETHTNSEPTFEEVYELMAQGVLAAIEKGKYRYCYHYPLKDRPDDTGVSSDVAAKIKQELKTKNWSVEIEDLSDLDGTIVFIIN